MIALIDTNVLVYAFDNSLAAKRQIAQSLLSKALSESGMFCVSIQNLSEFFAVVTSKIQQPLEKAVAAELVQKLVQFTGIVKIAPRPETVAKAVQFCATQNADYWDALLAATMLEYNIFTVHTENEKDFNKIPGITVINPFNAQPS
ncbi:PIN domain-containing protein [Candidatus Woesearchaeota archaeon]|nr:PIN domain-containing protein [Candidatus Woesearchaeota archaeon]